MSNDDFFIFVQSTSDYFTDFCDFCVCLSFLSFLSSGDQAVERTLVLSDLVGAPPEWWGECNAGPSKVNKINRSEESEVGSDIWNWSKSPVICDSSALKIADSDVHLRCSCHSGNIDSFGCSTMHWCITDVHDRIKILLKSFQKLRLKSNQLKQLNQTFKLKKKTRSNAQTSGCLGYFLGWELRSSHLRAHRWGPWVKSGAPVRRRWCRWCATSFAAEKLRNSRIFTESPWTSVKVWTYKFIFQMFVTKS